MRRKLQTTLIGLGVLALANVQAHAQLSAQPFSGQWQGSSQIVEVLDPGPPIVRFVTAATGAGSFDLVGYSSTDIINMATGVGSGSNVFTAGNGDQLFGSFTVQVVPTAVPGTVDLLGAATFTGGTGLFAGASGQAGFTGTALFTSPSTALASFSYDGTISMVPEPGNWARFAMGLAALATRWRRLRTAEPAGA